MLVIFVLTTTRSSKALALLIVVSLRYFCFIWANERHGRWFRGLLVIMSVSMFFHCDLWCMSLDFTITTLHRMWCNYNSWLEKKERRVNDSRRVIIIHSYMHAKHGVRRLCNWSTLYPMISSISIDPTTSQLMGRLTLLDWSAGKLTWIKLH